MTEQPGDLDSPWHDGSDPGVAVTGPLVCVHTCGEAAEADALHDLLSRSGIRTLTDRAAGAGEPAETLFNLLIHPSDLPAASQLLRAHGFDLPAPAEVNPGGARRGVRLSLTGAIPARRSGLMIWLAVGLAVAFWRDFARLLSK